MRAYVLGIALLAFSALAWQPADAASIKIAAWNIANLHYEVDVPLRPGAAPRSASDYQLLREYRAELDADIFAFQEINGPDAAHRVFPADEFDVFVSGRFQDDLDEGADSDRIYTGFAVRRGAGIEVIRVEDFRDLSILHKEHGEPDRPTRRGVDLTVRIEGQELRLLSVHLKSRCHQGNLESPSNAHCETLARQRAPLEDWMDARFVEGVPFIVLGDFNRRFDVFNERDHIWEEIDDSQPAGQELNRLPTGEDSQCWAGTGMHRYNYIDFIVFGPRAWELVDKSSFEQLTFRLEHADLGQRLSDHCPIAATLQIGAADDGRETEPEQVSFRVIGWNMESGESSSAFLRGQVRDKNGVDVWGFSEVANAAALSDFERGAEEDEGSDFRSILGTTGGGDRLAIVYDSARLELKDQQELTAIALGRFRAPLVAHFKGRQTGFEFLFMVNHLARGDASARLEQAELLNDWAQEQDLPVIAVGDYNFDYHVTFGDGGDRDEGFDAFVEDGAFIWVRPERLRTTQANPRYNTVLDFVFVANPPSGWTGASTILSRDGDQEVADNAPFPDSNSQTDHRPVDAVFAGVIADDDRDEHDEDDSEPIDRDKLIQRLDELQRSLEEIRELVTRQ